MVALNHPKSTALSLYPNFPSTSHTSFIGSCHLSHSRPSYLGAFLNGCSKQVPIGGLNEGSNAGCGLQAAAALTVHLGTVAGQRLHAMVDHHFLIKMWEPQFQTNRFGGIGTIKIEAWMVFGTKKWGDQLTKTWDVVSNESLITSWAKHRTTDFTKLGFKSGSKGIWSKLAATGVEPA